MRSWEEYVKGGIVRRTQINKGTIKSLIGMSENRLKIFSEMKLTEQNASVLFTNYYDSLREICEAIAVSKGYKIYLHEAIGLFLRETLKEEAIFVKFDKFRVMRNGVNYYGTPIPLNEAIQGIEDIKKIINQLKPKYLKEFQ